MCGRYRLKRHCERDLLGDWFLAIEKIDIEREVDQFDLRPTDPMPIIRMHGDLPIIEMRRRGFPATHARRLGKSREEAALQRGERDADVASVVPHSIRIEPLRPSTLQYRDGSH